MSNELKLLSGGMDCSVRTLMLGKLGLLDVEGLLSIKLLLDIIVYPWIRVLVEKYGREHMEF